MQAFCLQFLRRLSMMAGWLPPSKPAKPAHLSRLPVAFGRRCTSCAKNTRNGGFLIRSFSSSRPPLLPTLVGRGDFT